MPPIPSGSLLFSSFHPEIRNLCSLLDESISTFLRSPSSATDASRSGVKTEPSLAGVQEPLLRDANRDHIEPNALPSLGMLTLNFQSRLGHLHRFTPSLRWFDKFYHRLSPMYVGDLFPLKGPPDNWAVRPTTVRCLPERTLMFAAPTSSTGAGVTNRRSFPLFFLVRPVARLSGLSAPAERKSLHAGNPPVFLAFISR